MQLATATVARQSLSPAIATITGHDEATPRVSRASAAVAAVLPRRRDFGF